MSCSKCDKTNPGCAKCPRFEIAVAGDPHHKVESSLSGPVDVLIVGESPMMGRFPKEGELHLPYRDESGKIVRETVASLKKDGPYANLNVGLTYAARCTGKKINKSVLAACEHFLHDELKALPNTPVLVALGVNAAKALGVPAQSQASVQNRVFINVEVAGRRYTVVVSISMKQIVAMSGMFSTFTNDLQRAFSAALNGGKTATTPLEELTKNYIIPATVQEAKGVCDLIIGYASEGMTPDTSSISVDTETNTLFPHRANATALCVSFAWDEGKATAIPLWHRETKYDPAEVAPHIERVLCCPKPKLFHNIKFDAKVFLKLGWTLNNPRWCSLLAEHMLEEDKKGLYGLKPLTRRFFPEFAEYADVLHELLEKQEGDSQLDNVRKTQKERDQEAAELTAAAFEVTPTPGAKKKAPKKKKLRQEDGAFAKLPLDELLRYAAIDTDMTRRPCS